MSWPLLQIKNLDLRLGEQEIFKDFSLDIYPGQHTALLGINGTGKSSLLRIMAAKLWGTGADGAVAWLGEKGLEPYLLQGRKITALVSGAEQEALTRQDLSLSGYQLISGGFTDSLYLQTQPTAQEVVIIKDWASYLAASHLLDIPLNQLSVGQLRLLLLVRALVKQPQLLLLDEISEGLDVAHTEILHEQLRKIAKNTTLVLTSHRADFPDFIQQTIHLTSKEQSSRSLGQLSWQPAGVAIELCQANVYIDGKLILHDLNWSLQPGQNWAIIGANGSGKSTFLRLLAGDEFVAYGGSICYTCQGKILHTLAELRQHLCLVSDLQQAVYPYNLKVLDLLVSGLYNTYGLYIEPSENEYAQAWEMLRHWHWEKLAERTIRSLSSGQLRQMLLARALMSKPSVLLLDEPCSHLDAASRQDFLDLLAQISLEGVQIVMSSHHEADLLPGSQVLYL